MSTRASKNQSVGSKPEAKFVTKETEFEDYDATSDESDNERLIRDTGAQTNTVQVHKKKKVNSAEFSPAEWVVLQSSSVILSVITGFIHGVFIYKLKKPANFSPADQTANLSRDLSRAFFFQTYRKDENQDQVIDGIVDLLKVAALMALSYFLATFLTTLMIGVTPVLKFGRRYGKIMILEAVLLAVTAFFFQAESERWDFIKPFETKDKLPFSKYIACAVIGVHNTFVSAYGGGHLSSVNITGMTTDLAVFLARYLRQAKGADTTRFKRRLRMIAFLWTGFFVGCILGCVCLIVLKEHDFYGLYAVSGLVAVMSAVYVLYGTLRG